MVPEIEQTGNRCLVALSAEYLLRVDNCIAEKESGQSSHQQNGSTRRTFSPTDPDALQMPWTKCTGYAFPPFCLIGRCLRKAIPLGPPELLMDLITPSNSNRAAAVNPQRAEFLWKFLKKWEYWCTLSCLVQNFLRFLTGLYRSSTQYWSINTIPSAAWWMNSQHPLVSGFLKGYAIYSPTATILSHMECQQIHPSNGWQQGPASEAEAARLENGFKT